MPKLIVEIVFIFSLATFSCTQKPEDSNILEQNQESCLSCHSDLIGFSDAHNPQAIGCSSCHLGNTSSADQDIAHKGMVKIPGNLSNAAQTCSSTNCHNNELSRINNSLMATNSGIVSNDKYAFEEINHTDTFFHIQNIHHTAADKHLKNLCYKCHLGYEKKHYGVTSELSRGGGCLACHLNYKEKKKPNIKDKYHPALNLNIGNDKCFGCHSRSSRISTNFEGWYETVLSKKEIVDTTKYRILLDGRIFAHAEDDIHHKAGLLCIDCHSSVDMMGDGVKYKHENQAVKIQCIDCHPKDKYNKIDKQNAGNIAALDYVLRKYIHPTEEFIATQKDTIALVNTGFDEEGNAFLISKINQEKHNLFPMSKKCKNDKVHNNLDCSMCHTSWVTSCIGCHTAYDDNVKIKGKEQRGKWYEEIGEFNKALPVMGIHFRNGDKKIKPAIPGMIMTLDKTKYTGKKFGHDSISLRLFAPISAHTTTSNTRSCESCHLSSEALGYGKGKLYFNNKFGNWEFESLYDFSSSDGLPQDAWIGFLTDIDHSIKYSAHKDFYPLSLEKQKKILKVGSCLYCHVNNIILKDEIVEGKYKQLAAKCKYYNK